MSTKNLLDPNRKKLRKRRRKAAREMQSIANSYMSGTPASFRVASKAAVLEEIINDPRKTGEEKDAAFRRVLNRQENLGRATGEFCEEK